MSHKQPIRSRQRSPLHWRGLLAPYVGGGELFIHPHICGALGGDSNPQPPDSKNWDGASMASMEPCTVYGLYEMNLKLLHTVYGVYGVLSILHRNCTRSAPELHPRGSPKETLE